MGQLCQNAPCAQGVPGSIYVCVEVLLSGLASADAVAWVVVGEDVAVDASAKTDIETAHLAKIDGVTVREKHCKSERMHVKRQVSRWCNSLQIQKVSIPEK